MQGGRTPLYSAVIDGDEDLVQILLDAKADVNITAQVTQYLLLIISSTGMLSDSFNIIEQHIRRVPRTFFML